MTSVPGGKHDGGISAPGLWDYASRHPVLAALIVLIALYLLRREVAAICTRSIKPLVGVLKKASERAAEASSAQHERGMLDWRAIGHNRTSAPNTQGAMMRLFVGMLGASMVFVSLFLSAELLNAPVRVIQQYLVLPATSDNGAGQPPAGSQATEFKSSTSAQQTPHASSSSVGIEKFRRITILMVAFELVLGLLILEFCGITSVFKFKTRLSVWSRWFFVAILVLTLAALAFTEANILKFANEDIQNTICWNYQLDEPPCESTPDQSTGTQTKPSDADKAGLTAPEDTPDPVPPYHRFLSAKVGETFHTLDLLSNIMFYSAFLMPFAYMIVGLSFDFFEEVISPLAHLTFAAFLAVCWISLIATSHALHAVIALAEGAIQTLTRPLAVAASLLSALFERIFNRH